MDRVYLDYNSTTPLDPEIREYFQSDRTYIAGNPSSIHKEGRKARRALEDARNETAALFGCEADEIVFTGSGSESNNIAIRGLAQSLRHRGKHLITTEVEHPSVMKTFDDLESSGWKVTRLEVDNMGRIDLDSLSSSIRDNTVLLSMMMANNETGVIFPVREAASIAKERGVTVHTDAVQAVGKIDVKPDDLNVDLLSLAAHKFYGPKGVGALYVKRGTKLKPQTSGGGQEFGLRAGTENIQGIMGLAMALRIATESLHAEKEKIEGLMMALRKGIGDLQWETVFNGDSSISLPNTLNVSFKGVSGESLVMALDLEGFAVSAGSACASGALKPSHVLKSMGLDEDRMRGALRISLGRWTRVEQIRDFLNTLPLVLERIAGEGSS